MKPSNAATMKASLLAIAAMALPTQVHAQVGPPSGKSTPWDSINPTDAECEAIIGAMGIPKDTESGSDIPGGSGGDAGGGSTGDTGTTTGGAPIAMPNGSSAKCREGMNMARTDQASIKRAKDASGILKDAAARAGVDWRLLAAIAIRETNFKNASSFDNGWGVFQLTNQPGVSKQEAYDVRFAANYAAKMLSRNMAYIKRKFPNFTPGQLLQATAASYNFGPGNIRGNADAIDRGTTGNNYGQNVILLMNCF